MPSGVHTGGHKIEPGEEVHLDKVDPNDTSGFEGKGDDEREESKRLNEKLRELQEMLYAEHKTKVLVILQAVDTGGKDGIIHRVFDGVNPQASKSHTLEYPPWMSLTMISCGGTTNECLGGENWLFSTEATTKAY